MYDNNNIFAKIIRNEIPCDKIFEDDKTIFFNDINPKAKIHMSTSNNIQEVLVYYLFQNDCRAVIYIGQNNGPLEK